MAKLKHSKRRNVGLVYELLAREVAEAMIGANPSKRTRAATALSIIERNMGPGSGLEDELSLHRGVMEARGCNQQLARRIVDELRSAGIRLSSRSALRDDAKTRLIHEINRRLGPEIFGRWVPDYTVHASVGIMLSRGLASRLDEGIDLARVEEHLVSFLSSPADVSQGVDPDANLYTYRTAVALFEREYGKTLTSGQADLLREEVRLCLGGPSGPMERLVERQRVSLRSTLSSAAADDVFVSDPKMSEQLSEAVAGLETLPAGRDAVERLMLYHDLVAQIEAR